MRLGKAVKLVERIAGISVDLSGVELTPEMFDDHLELLEIPVEEGGVFELWLESVGLAAPDAGVTIPMLRISGGVSLNNTFDMAVDSPSLVTNSTTDGEPWALSDNRRGLIVEDGVIRVTAWVADSTDPLSAPSNSLTFDKGALLIRELRGV